MAYSFDPKDDVEAQWQKWSAQNQEPEFLQMIPCVRRLLKTLPLYQAWM
jgi:hypothetical protein